MADVLTEEQRAAVEDRGRGLLVSAAAGSGKTRVLVERLFSYVLQEGANVDDFLIITYTRAAASELRGKIAAALADRLRDDPGSAQLRRQLLRVYRADIKTVDAFCTALLRENCHLLPEDAQRRALRPDFRVLDERDAETLRRRVLARTLDRFYEGLEPGDGGTLLADTLGAGRDDRALESLVLELHRKVQAQAYPDRWLEEREREWLAVPESVDDTLWSGLLLGFLRAKALHWAALLESAAAEMSDDAKLSQGYAPCFLSVSETLRALAEATEQGWDAARARTPQFPRLNPVRKAEDPARKDRMKRLWDDCKASVAAACGKLSASAAEAASDLRAMAPAMAALLRLTADFSRAFQEEKRRRNAADFSDQEHEAIRLLIGGDGAPTELARTVAGRYREIMVDEYQDTNEVQNRIFEAISRDGANLFTVGDVKQSIYRFRLADPTIFLEHYNTYPNAADAAAGERAKLILSRNFRSRQEVLEAANFVFANVLSKEMGELDYGPAEALRPGAAYPENADCRTEFHLLSMARQEGTERVRAPEAEAGFVARRIRALLDDGFTVTDGETRQPRPVREEDIVILMRAPGPRIADYRRALAAQGLRLSADQGEDSFSSMEVSVLFALLQIVDNPRQDVPLIAVLRSPLFCFDADRLAHLRAASRNGCFYDAILAAEGEDVERFLDVLRALRLAAQTMSVRRLLARACELCHAEEIFGAMADGAERRENVRAFLAFAEAFEKDGSRGLFDFVTQVRALEESGGMDAPKSARGTGGVRVMSIHKSKGLEFPVVILADLAKAFNNMDFTASVLVHPKFGVGPYCVDTARRIYYSTAAREAIALTLRREAKAEELRLLYVAMTRAKEKLILVHTQANAESRLKSLAAAAACPALPESVDGGKCLGDWVMLPLLCRPEAEPLRRLAGFDVSKLAVTDDTPWVVAVHDALSCADSGTQQRVDAAASAQAPDTGLPVDPAVLAWSYPCAASTRLSAKLTATQLKGRAADAEIAENAKLPPRLRSLEAPRFLAGERRLTGAERGTALHLVMEHLDLNGGTDAEAVRAQLAALRKKRLLTPEQAEAVDVDAVVRFLQSGVAARIRAGSGVRREYRFSLLCPARDYDPAAAENDEVLLQGVVDLFFEEDGALVVLDFKTDRIAPGGEASRAETYRAQLETYAAAISRVLGLPVKEKLLYFFATGESVAI